MVFAVKLHLFRESNSNNEVVFSKGALQKLGATPGEHLSFKIGACHRFSAKAAVSTDRRSALGLPSDVFDELGLALIDGLHVKREGDTIHIGPTIGIMGAGKFDPERRHQQDMLNYAQTQGYIAFLFSPEDYNWANNTITGETMPGHRQPGLPLPTAIYNRIHTRDEEHKLRVEAIKNRMRALGSHIYNPGFFDKWEVHEHLMHGQKLRKYLPETHRAPTPALLKKILGRHHSAYLKPVDGRGGKMLMRLTKREKGYRLQWLTDLSCPHADFVQLEDAFEFAFCHTSLDQYLVQQSLDFSSFDGRSVDCRVQMHKDISGTWRCLMIGPRVCAYGCISSHFSQGADIVGTDDYFINAFGKKAEAVKAAVEECGFAIAHRMDEYHTSPIGELGLDVGIDKSGHPKLLEINAKPGRMIFLDPRHAEARVTTLEASIDYGAFLSGFGEDPE
ncbi:YheC/YheD family protein [Pseudovibrio brasiliensis]|uniref:YheC/YheD family protein n=1 Tax=Pseudovibrio brasiliensis TaxID=1898042 RepID=A0ABX8AVV1_9HYPH|nr:YheC/YheD family protein [Pseudovibrio brasiliensis]QUS58812.1 YheC/YheD family protein [Pseudovibrio brasiliensis]